MKTGCILISVVERSEYIVNIEVSLDDGSEISFLQLFEVMNDNVSEVLDNLHQLILGYKVKVLFVPYEEEYKKFSFSNIGKVNVSKNIKKSIKRYKHDHQVVHSLLVNKPNALTKSWNFILVLVPFHKITDQIFSFFVEKKIKIEKIHLTSLINLDVANKVINTAPVQVIENKLFIYIAISQIGRYLYIVVFVNNAIYDIFRYSLSNLKENKEEILFKIKSIENTIFSSELVKDKESDLRYVLLNDHSKLSKILFEGDNDFSRFCYKKLSALGNLQDITSVINKVTLRLKLIATKLVYFSNLSRLSKFSSLLNKMIAGFAVIFLAFSCYVIYLVKNSDDGILSLEQKLNNKIQRLSNEEQDHRDKIQRLNENSKTIFYNLKSNKYPLDLLNVIKKVTEYRLIITNIKYQSGDDKKLILDIHIPMDLVSRNSALYKIANFFQYLKLNLPAHNEIRFYRNTIQEWDKGIPVQIVIIDKKL